MKCSATKRSGRIYDQVGEEGLKGQPPPGAGAGGGMGGFSGMNGMPPGFSFSFAPGGGGGGGGGQFNPRDPNDIFKQFFGGGGGLGGMSSMFGGMGDDDDNPMGGMAGMGGMGGMGSRKRAKPAALVTKLSLSLEELYHGAVKKMKITRQRRNDSGELVSQPKVVEIPIKAGYKAGRRSRLKAKATTAATALRQPTSSSRSSKPNIRASFVAATTSFTNAQ